MQFSILHISDLHRDLTDEIDNKWLLDSLAKDFEQIARQTPKIAMPALAIVSGDLVHGIRPGLADGGKELNRQYKQAGEFLIGLCEQFFEGKRERIVILPGNHDVSYDDVMASAQRIEIPAKSEKKSQLVSELFEPNSRLRWSWRDLCFYRVVDQVRYDARLHCFASTYESFYQGRRTFPLAPERQYDIFDFPELGFSVAALNSCFNNDPLHRSGAFNHAALGDVCRALRRTERAGWLLAAAWHHNITGSPVYDDYLDSGFLQLLIDVGVSLGFHGHQHMPECFDERYRIGPSPRKMTVVSASTLCAEPRNLKPGVPRSYNIVELDTAAWTGRVHQRQMVNMLFSLPVWGPGHFNVSNTSYLDFELCKPLTNRPPQLDIQLLLERADRCMGARLWGDAISLLEKAQEHPLARPLMVRALSELEDSRKMIDALWPPLTTEEAVMIGGAILEVGTMQEAAAFSQLSIARDSTDASIRDMLRRIKGRRPR
jgi:3',5'-cyclic AMP phosphodiesterase CpdA